MLRKMMCCVVFVGVVLSASVLSAETWNWNTDYPTSVSQLGANHNWQCGYEFPAGTYNTATVLNVLTGYGAGNWYRTCYAGTDTDSRGSCEKSEFSAPYENFDVYWEANQTYLFPGKAAPGNPVDLRWTCPADGTYNISTMFGSAVVSGDYVPANYVVGVKLDGLSNAYLWSDTLDGFVGRAVNNYADATGVKPSTTLGGILTLTQGQTLDFIVQSAGTNTFRYTKFDATITTVPEPSTLALLAGGLFGLVAYAWRKRK